MIYQIFPERFAMALVHKYAQPIEFITLCYLTQKNVTC
jgi:hypothetical protein